LGVKSAMLTLLPPLLLGQSSYWSVGSASPSGACYVTSMGQCVTTGAGYANNERCTMYAQSSFWLDVQSFETESSTYDYIYIQGQRYGGSTGPSGIYMTSGTSMTWSTDGSVTRSGFRICASLVATPVSSSYSYPPPPSPRPPPGCCSYEDEEGGFPIFMLGPLIMFFAFASVVAQAKKRARQNQQTTGQVLRSYTRGRWGHQQPPAAAAAWPAPMPHPQQQMAVPMATAVAVPVQPMAMPVAPMPDASVSVADQLAQLSIMQQNGLLSVEQFEAAKQQLLGTGPGAVGGPPVAVAQAYDPRMMPQDGRVPVAAAYVVA